MMIIFLYAYLCRHNYFPISDISFSDMLNTSNENINVTFNETFSLAEPNTQNNYLIFVK